MDFHQCWDAGKKTPLAFTVWTKKKRHFSKYSLLCVTKALPDNQLSAVFVLIRVVLVN